jgi:hypothetical protein
MQLAPLAVVIDWSHRCRRRAAQQQIAAQHKPAPQMRRRFGEDFPPVFSRRSDVARRWSGWERELLAEARVRAVERGEVAEESAGDADTPVRRCRIWVASERGCDCSRVRWDEGCRSNGADDADDLLGRCLDISVVRACRELRESRPDSKTPRRAFGRTASFCVSSYSCAASRVSNALRRRWPLRSYQSA